MPTVIDSLLVELGLDASKFNQEQKKSVESLRKFGEQNRKTNEEAQRHAKELEEGYTKIRNAIIGVGTAIVGVNGFKDFVRQMVTGNAALGRTSQLLGMNVRDLDAWGAATKSVGGTAEGFQASLQNIVGGLQKFKMGMGGEEVVQALARLNVQAKNGAVDLYELAAALKRVRDQQGIQAALALGQQLGLDQSTFQLMMMTNDELVKLVDRMRAASGAKRENTKEAQALQKAWAELTQTGNGLAQNVFSNITPALQGMLAVAKWAADNFKKLDDMVGGAASTFIATAAAIQTTRMAVEKLAALFGIGAGGWLSKFFAFANRASVGAQLLFHSEGLNKGEQEALDKKWAAAGYPAAGGKGPSISSNAPRGIRNNNPGNIRFGDFAKAHGATTADKDGFAVFPTMAAGEKAMQDLLQSYRGKGIDTISGIVSRWAPSSENDTSAYIKDVSAKTGIGANQHLDMSQYAAVQRAIAMHENGPAYARASTVETHIGTINVNTQATDAGGVARDMHTALAHNALITAGMVGAN